MHAHTCVHSDEYIHTLEHGWCYGCPVVHKQTGFSLKFDYELEGGGGHCYNYLLCVAVIVHFLD